MKEHMLAATDHAVAVARLGDDELMQRLAKLLSEERGVLAKLLMHLAEADARGLYRERGFSSMFEYCVRALLATRFAKPDVPAVIRRLPERAPVSGALAAMPLAFEAADTPRVAVECDAPAVPGAQPAPEPRLVPQSERAGARPTLRPLSPSRYKLQLTAGQQLHDKLQQARDLMRHELPDGDLAQIVERALDLLIAERMKRRFGIGRKPRGAAKKAPKIGSRHIPHAVSRNVVARDQLQCTFVSPDGRRCTACGWLQLHHEKPFGRGGPATEDNIRVLCRSHNLLLAERDYGRDFIQQRIARARSQERPAALAPGRGPGS